MGDSSPRVLGRYTLHRVIASGGMATVHYGRFVGPAGFARTIAIKRLRPHFAQDPEFVTMFLDEARLAARVRHPNVVPTLDVVAVDGEVFLVMEYVDGESLSQLVRAAGENKTPIPPRVACAIVSGVLHGLHAAHEARTEKGLPLEIVHRDVSLSNVLVGRDGLARLVDFGVARASERLRDTKDLVLKGKLAYMAPELFAGKAPTRVIDVYAAGVVLWELLTSERLFPTTNEATTISAVIANQIAAPSTRAKGIPRALDEVVMRALSADLSRRFATARAMTLALEGAMPIATPSAVAQWVEKAAHDALESRAAIVAEIESGETRPPTSEASAAAGSETSTDRIPHATDAAASQTDISVVTEAVAAGGRSRRAMVAGGLAVAGAIALASVLIVSRTKQHPAAPAPAPVAAPTETTEATTVARASAAAPAETKPAASATTSSRASSTAPAKRPAASSSSRPSSVLFRDPG